MALLREPASGSRQSVAQIRAAGGPRAALAATAGLFADEAERRAAREIDGWRAEGITLRSYCDHGFPTLLRDSEAAPPLLFLRGELIPADSDGVAVIGTRQPSEDGARQAASLAAALAESGRAVISGLAAGIDTAAHHAAVAAGGRSIAVLGNGLRHVYPPANAELQSRLHVLVSQFWPEQRPSRASFPLRNAVMAGISRATVIVEASERSGARIQARSALAQGRELFLMAPMLDQAWARALVDSGAASVIDGPERLLDALR